MTELGKAGPGEIQRSLPPPPPTLDEPYIRRSVIEAMRRTTLELFGAEGLADLRAYMLPETYHLAVEPILLVDEWLPERCATDWCTAIWSGLLSKDDHALERFLQRTMDHGFARIRRLFLNVATPEMLLARAAELWRREHTHGVVTAQLLAPGSGTIMLEDHLYLATSRQRRVVAEVFRYALSLTRVERVTCEHSFVRSNCVRSNCDRALVVHLRWQ